MLIMYMTMKIGDIRPFSMSNVKKMSKKIGFSKFEFENDLISNCYDYICN